MQNFSGNLKQGDHLGDLDIGWRIILNGSWWSWVWKVDLIWFTKD